MNSIFNIDDFPKREAKPEFWALIENKDLHSLLNFFILNAVRVNASVALSQDQCRTKLSKVEALGEFLDFILILPDKIEGSGQQDKLTDEEILATL